MKWQTEDLCTADVNGTRLEYACWGPKPSDAPTIVLMHEGLGCTALWRDFPKALQAETGHGVFAYSRQGYGGSAPCALPRPLDYMQREATEVVPAILDAIGFERGILLGHSDGGSIAAHYLGTHQDHRVRGLVLMAPHFFTEAIGVQSIHDIRKSFVAGELRDRLARYHRDNVDCAFYGWADAWTDPGFTHWDISESIAYIRVPILFIQGKDDAYGSEAQADIVVAESYAPVDIHMLDNCGHAPHLEQPDVTMALITNYVQRLESIEAAEPDAA